MKDPLLHLMRNCIDHGIEKPEQRRRSNKPVRGRILITISRRNGDKVEILIADDGAGMDTATVKAAAVNLGIASAEDAEQLDAQQTLSLIFRSGFTTSQMLTDVSGRGLGLAILQEKVDKLGGIVSLDTSSNGTTFRILLPLSLATFRGIVVRLEDQLFVLPTVNVSRTLRISNEQIKTVENRETVQLNGRTVPLFRLGDVLEMARTPNDSRIGMSPAVVVGSAERRAAFLVDEVLHEQEILVKHLGKQLARVRNIAGATILGTGRVVNILNISDLMKSTLKVSAAPIRTAVAEKQPKRKAILVVEDSITARTLLKNILESAGYSVTTAVDGLEGFSALKEGEYALVVTDVDMPRMNGLDLTAKIRSDKKLSETPVVLVTALESREDREKGIDVGANAYIVKSSFDQSNLLEAIRRLT